MNDTTVEVATTSPSTSTSNNNSNNTNNNSKNNTASNKTNNSNIRVGTLEEATANNDIEQFNNNNNKGDDNEKYVYRDFAKIEEEEYDIDYEMNQEGLTIALEEATAMAANQLLSSPSSSIYTMPTVGGGNHGPPALSSRMVRASGWCRSQRFPVKLYALLSQPRLSHIISWMPHGRSWKVLNPREFEASILPVFFESDNYHSFNRVINAWSFRRKSTGPDRGSYFHELFLRGKPHLQKHMRRLPRTHKKLAMDKSEEPDFFELEKISPLPTLAESKFRLEARKMRRMQDQLHGGPPRAISNDNYHQQGNSPGKSTKDGDTMEQRGGGGEKTANGSPGDEHGKAAGYQQQHDGESMEHAAGPMSFVEQERLRRMREDQLLYQHQRNMIQSNPLGLPYGGMGPMGYSGYNPYYMPPPS
ncbi:HSF-type DNA-binding protein [Nitzschia inconspicua]|uniref:HSF-type DNA-binding protein n=1 Tax=Nitzschia inconspicua TaxID=303405 RepID=A0A9K3KVT5_9STRA|nr:HSF-type DNA-binding protein [Nitzschia inconspicua]